ncbi:hypothetical protein TWF102_007208 [Orbilia oligospora]|nr:hypothetical protein TWF102_007208 [Orbilia oligospora]
MRHAQRKPARLTRIRNASQDAKIQAPEIAHPSISYVILSPRDIKFNLKQIHTRTISIPSCRTTAYLKMGFWTRQPTAAKDSSAPIEAAAAAASHQPPNDTPAVQQNTPRSRDDVAEEEFSALLKTLHDEDPSRKEAVPQNNFQDTLYPTTMSCREAFDELYFCYSLGGQFKNLYRHGTYRQCEDKSADFWFCMRTKMYGPNTKKEMIVKYHKEKEAEKYKRGPSSEDVWKEKASVHIVYIL